jgi:hypothetical protein|tara:strand:+ start:973 stop:2415 length:1443 start_codon:yes stop_codon:yes gene_type:complete
MAVIIQQRPLYGNSQNGALPVGQQIIFTVELASAIQTKWNVKYIAEVHVSNTPINLSTNDALVATFKTTPNNAGVGIFDFRSLFESYTSADNTGKAAGTTSISEYKGVDYSLSTPHPLHLIDKFCRSQNAIKYFAIQFKAEGSSSATAPVLLIANSAENTEQFTFFNGVLQQDNYLTLTGADYGYDLSSNLFYTGGSVDPAKFLTNAPTTQYATINDYGTVGFLNFLPTTSDKVAKIILTYKDSAGSTIGSNTVIQNNSNGGASGIGGTVHTQLMYFGCFPANLRNWSSTFQALVAADTIAYYEIAVLTNGGVIQQLYTINIKCADSFGYEPIRLTWLNQWGVWDYYTFTKKSVRSTSTNRTTYTQTSGTWNDDTFRIDGYKGGKKNFRVNSTEKIKVNTNFVSEAEAEWFEELVNSPEVYILNGFDSTESAPYNTMTNKYVEPVLVTTSNYIRKTKANDRLIQYTFELERNKTQRTQTS